MRKKPLKDGQSGALASRKEVEPSPHALSPRPAPVKLANLPPGHTGMHLLAAPAEPVVGGRPSSHSVGATPPLHSDWNAVSSRRSNSASIAVDSNINSSARHSFAKPAAIGALVSVDL